MAKFLSYISGALTEVVGLVTSAGSADAGKLIQTDASGRLDTTLMPTGIGADVATIQASEALSANDVVNVWSSSGASRVRKADASAAGKPGHGFVLAAVASGANATVYFEGTNAGLTGLTPGEVYLSATTPGAVTATAPTTAGQVAQLLGFATGTTAFNFQYSTPITRS